MACRLDDLVPVVAGLGDGGSAVGQRVDKTRAAAATSQGACRAGDKRGAKRGLKSGMKQLTRLATVLKSKRTRSIPADVRAELSASVQALRGDVRALRAALACPTDAG